MITLSIYSLISTIVYIVSGENENVIVAFGLGIFGLILIGVTKAINKIKDLYKYHIGKRSIFEEKKSRTSENKGTRRS